MNHKSNSGFSDRVECSFDNGIARVYLNRPEKLNALDMPMFRAIDETINRLRKHKKLRVVIVSGKGDSFCSGLDVKSVMNNQLDAVKLLWKWYPRQANLAQRVTVGWRKLDVPVIMALHGKCWGGGMQIALGGDFRIASPDCSLAIMESRWGLIPDMGGTIALRENVAVDQAMKLAMSGEPVTAQNALTYNLITQIDDDPVNAANELAEILKKRSPDTNRAIKKIYHRSWCNQSGKILARETINQWRILLRENRKVAVKKQLGDTDIEYR